MSLQLVTVEGREDLENERVVLRASTDLNIGKYLVLRTKSSDDGKVYSGAIPAAFWLVTMNVKAGDFVVLYTKSGQRSQKNDEDGTSSYFFYWGMQEAAWKAEFKPTLMLAASWNW